MVVIDSITLRFKELEVETHTAYQNGIETDMDLPDKKEAVFNFLYLKENADVLMMDFENNILQLDNTTPIDFPDLKNKKEEILKILEFENINLQPFIDGLTALLNNPNITHKDIESFFEKAMEK